MPTAHIEIFGLKGEAVFDSDAKTSVTSLNLKKILTKNGSIFQDVRADICLADGSVTTSKVMSTICDVTIGNRIRKIRLIYLPNATKNRTLLGADFLEQAGIVLNMAQRCWYFEDDPKTRHLFTNPLEIGVFAMDVNGEEISPCSRAVKEVSAFIKFIEEQKIISPLPGVSVTPPHSNNFPSGVATCDDVFMRPRTPPHESDNNYSPHSVQAIFEDALPVGQRTPSEASKLFAPPAKSRKTQQDEYCDAMFMPLYSLDIHMLKDSDGIDLTHAQRNEMDKLLVSNNDIFGESNAATPFAVHRIHTEEH